MERMMMLPEEERKKMGRYGREKMTREYDASIVIEIYLDAIDTILTKQREAGN